ncbi:MAG: homoserine kinase [Magnetococcales bacterium]|nr:homoserine kinase [Magnetococcales bacterium]
MSVYTPVTPGQLQPLLAHYGVGTLVGLSGIAQGMDNTNYRVTTTGGEFVLTLVEDPDQARDLDHLIRVTAHLAQAGVPCPRPLADRQGRVRQELNGRPALLTGLLPGDWPRRPSPDQCRAAGALLARIHLAGADFADPRPNPMDPGRWRTLFRELSDRLSTAQPGTHALIQDTLEGLQQRFLLLELPTGLCHADLFPDNTLFHDGRLTGVLDFHYACRERWLLDLAITLAAWSLQDQGPWQPEQFLALLTGYRQLRPLTPEEQEALPLALEGACLRFLLTRLRAWLGPRSGDMVQHKDPEDFAARLRWLRGTGKGVISIEAIEQALSNRQPDYR